MKKTTKSFVAFIDILGFKQMINDFESNKKPDLLEKLSQVVELLINFLTDKPNFQTEPYNKWKENLVVKSFSDCFCVSVPFDYELLDFTTHVKLFYQHVAIFQNELFKKGFPNRGAIAVGSFYSDNNLIFSNALVDAYLLESKSAIYPRILAHESFLEAISLVDKKKKSFMLINELSNVFINPFNFNLIDAAESDKEIEDRILGSGVILNSFEDVSLDDKAKNIRFIKERYKKEIETNSFDEKIMEKYKWLIDLCSYELGEKHNRFERYK